MKAAKPRQIGAWIVLAVLVAFLCAAIAFMYVGWGPGEGERGQEMSTAGYVAMALGIIVTLALGMGLMALVFYSNREGHDRDADLKRDE
jgi:formate hydrogenlyase subunit 3/multisubunit Na+/H+ antiporter MnhD subunit